jgi:hypothetical protein
VRVVCKLVQFLCRKVPSRLSGYVHHGGVLCILLIRPSLHLSLPWGVFSRNSPCVLYSTTCPSVSKQSFLNSAVSHRFRNSEM